MSDPQPATDGGRFYITGGQVALGEAVRQYGTSTWGVSISDLYAGSYAPQWSERLGQPGIPMSTGVLRLEKNPRYIPLQARGQGSDPGVFWRLSRMPQAQRALSGPADAISGSSVRLEAPPLREWHDPQEAQRAQQFQLELCQRALDQWQTPSEDGSGWRRFVREVLLTAPVCGFAWFEIMADLHTVDMGLYEVRERASGGVYKKRVGSVPRSVLIPRIPEWRAPWAVQYWLTQNERLVGVDARFDQATDYKGTQGRYRTIIPRDKILLVTHRRIGSNFEGTSALREAAEFFEMLQSALRTEALAVEVNGLGELIIYEPPDGGFNKVADEGATSDFDRVQNYLNHRSTKVGNGLILPHGSKAEVLTPQSQLPDLGPMQDRLERMIMLGLNRESGLIATQGHGSFAARKDASATERDTYDAIFNELIADPVERLFSQMIQINFPEDWRRGYRFVPQLRIGQVEERDNKVWLESVKVAADAKAITLGLEDEEVIRDMLDLPSLSEEAKAARGQGSGDMAPADKLQQGRLALDAIYAPPPVGPYFAALLGVPTPTDEERQAYLAYKNGEANLPPQPTLPAPEMEEVPATPEAPPGRFDHVDPAPPQDVRGAAAWALVCSRQKPADERLSAADKVQAVTLSKGLPLNLSALQRLKAYHDNTPSQAHLEASQDIAWLSWMAAGGEAGKRWVDEVVAALDAPPALEDDPATFAGEEEETALAESPEKYAHIDFKPTAGMVEAAKRALSRRAEKPASQRGMTPVGLARARDIANGKTLSPDTWRRVKAYFDRHESDKSGSTWDDYGKGRQAWDGWGGDAGKSRAAVVVRQMDAADEEEG